MGRQTNICWSLVLCLVIFLSLPLQVFSQNGIEQAFIEDIRVTVNGEPEKGEMEELIPISPGESYSLKRIRDAVKRLYKTGLFADIQVQAEGDPGVRLLFHLTKRLFVRTITFQSFEEVPQKTFRDSLFVFQEGGAYSDKRLNRAKQEFAGVLEHEGFFDPDIKTTVEFDVSNSQVDILFSIRAAKKYTVDRITFGGEFLVDESELKKEMQTETGKIYIPRVFEEDMGRIRDIYLSMGYQRVEIKLQERRFDEEKDVVSLRLLVTPHEKIEIVVQGADIPKDLLKPLWEARVFEEWALREGEAKIITYLRERNYLFPFVSSSIKREKNSLRVIYDVVPGERHRVQDIQLKGARYFTPTQIKEKLGIPERIPFLSKISGARLYELPREIEFLYRMEGFSETKVDLNFLRQQKTVRPILYIKEGKQDTIARLSIEGFRLFTRKQLLDEINSHEGGAFFRPNVQKDIQKLEVFYMNQGVRGSNIRVLVRQESESGYDVRFQIEEGRKVKIENVVISGNEVTQTSIISRELLVKEGDLAFFDAIRTTKRRLEGLGVFSQIKIEEIPVSQDRINLLISLIEGRRNYASLGLGIETKNTPRSFAVWDYVIRPRGTAEFIRSNIFGFAGQLSLVGQVSLREQRAVASWEQPYFFGMPMQMVVNAWLEREERESYSFDRRGISLSTFRSLSSKEEMVFLTTFRFARTTLFELFVAESEVDRQHFPFSTTSVSGSFIWDRRDDPFNPEKGFFFSSVLEWAYPLFNAESNYQRTFSKYQHHIPVFPGITFITTTRLGLGRGRMPIHERFFAGGSNSFRGVKFDKLGPKDPDSFKPVGGKALLLFNLELAFPILSRVKNLFGIVFFDKGNVFERRKQVSWAALQDAVGFGIRYRTPLGPIRFELGWNLDAPAGERKPLVFITIGNVF